MAEIACYRYQDFSKALADETRKPVVLVTMVEVKGASPAQVGFKLLRWPDGRVMGNLRRGIGAAGESGRRAAIMSDDNLLLHSFTIIQVMDCIADPTKNRIIAELSDDVSPVFPYLNAVVSNLMYNPGANTVTVKRGGRILTFYPHVAVMAKVDGAEDAAAQLTWFKDLCNDTWRRRGEITPCYERRKLLGPLDVYRLLPKLNCKACGEATCMAFAFELLLSSRHLSECPRLQEDAFAESGQRLAEFLGL